MGTYKWASPLKAREYYLDRAGKTAEDLWHAVHDGHIRVRIMDVDFAPEQTRALLTLIHFDIEESQRTFELPIWMKVNIDDVERVLCGADKPMKRRGRPEKSGDQIRQEYNLARTVSNLLASGKARSVRQAADLLISEGRVQGNSLEAKQKTVERAYSRFFRKD